MHSLILTENNEIYGFGRNDHGELGDGTTINRLSPVISNNDNYKNLIINEIFGSLFFTIFITNDFNVFYSGNFKKFQFDEKFLTNSLIPVKLNFFNLKITKLFVSTIYSNVFLVSNINEIYTINENSISKRNSINYPNYFHFTCNGIDFLSACMIF
jgi:alpha-tubulin suppressor-like RCC1 family protein